MRAPAVFLAICSLWTASLPALPVGLEAAAQEEPGPGPSPEESRALESWARELLAEAAAPEGQGETALPPHRDVQRLWALYFLAVNHSSRLDEARVMARSLLERDLSPSLRESVRGLAGALEVVRAKHSRWPPNKLKYLEAGMGALDELVSRRPDSPEARYLRLVSGYYLPFFLKRGEAVEEDFRALAGLLPGGPGGMPSPVFRAAVLFVLEKGALEESRRAELQEILG